jgi:hypothetical protein
MSPESSLTGVTGLLIAEAIMVAVIPPAEAPPIAGITTLWEGTSRLPPPVFPVLQGFHKKVYHPGGIGTGRYGAGQAKSKIKRVLVFHSIRFSFVGN